MRRLLYLFLLLHCINCLNYCSARILTFYTVIAVSLISLTPNRKNLYCLTWLVSWHLGSDNYMLNSTMTFCWKKILRVRGFGEASFGTIKIRYMVMFYCKQQISPWFVKEKVKYSAASDEKVGIRWLWP